MKTYMAKSDSINRKWYVVDAAGKRLGRLSSEIVSVLRGKHKPEFTPHLDMGDYIIVINAEKVSLTGNKENQKLYRRHTGYIGNLKTIPYKDMMKKYPVFVNY